MGWEWRRLPLGEGDVIAALVRRLMDPARRVPANTFPLDPVEAAQPGLYTWWADAEGQNLVAHVLRCEIPELIYAGEAGATRWPSGQPSGATLGSRIEKNHLRGNVESSTFRKTLSAILKGPLGLQVMGSGRLVPEDNRRVTEWIGEHLRVAVVAFHDRDELAVVEEAVLHLLDPPLNLQGRPRTPIRHRLSQLRENLVGP
jgi:hypothetical protein